MSKLDYPRKAAALFRKAEPSDSIAALDTTAQQPDARAQRAGGRTSKTTAAGAAPSPAAVAPELVAYAQGSRLPGRATIRQAIARSEVTKPAKPLRKKGAPKPQRADLPVKPGRPIMSTGDPAKDARNAKQRALMAKRRKKGQK